MSLLRASSCSLRQSASVVTASAGLREQLRDALLAEAELEQRVGLGGAVRGRGDEALQGVGGSLKLLFQLARRDGVVSAGGRLSQVDVGDLIRHDGQLAGAVRGG